MQMKTKGDIARGALRKGSVASDATLTDVEPQSLADALADLEMMMAEWEFTPGRGISVGYIYSPDDSPVMPEDEHGLPAFAIAPVMNNLSCRILPDYVIEANQKLVMMARNGKELLVKSMTGQRTPHLHYRNRTPIGSGNLYPNWIGVHFFHYRGRSNGEDDSSSS